MYDLIREWAIRNSININVGQGQELAKLVEEKFSSTNTGSPKCPLCGSNSFETRTVRVCFNRSCHYIEASRPLRAGA